MIAQLEPIKNKTPMATDGSFRWDNILLKDERGYPWALIHIDFFDDDKDLYERIYKYGQYVEIEIKIKE